MKRQAITNCVGVTCVGLLLASCTLLGGGDIPCDADSNCPGGQVCNDNKICVVPVAGEDGGIAGADASMASDAATAQDTTHTPDVSPGVDRADAGGATGTDAASGQDLARSDGSQNPDAGSAALCESPPCVIMPDSATTFCRDDDTNGPDPCPAPGSVRYGQDGNYEGPYSVYTDLGEAQVADARTGLTWINTPTGSKQRNWTGARDACAALTTGGHNDWRLATVAELTSLLDFGTGAQESMLDANFFPAPSFFSVWSADGYNDFYWIVGLHDGSTQIKLGSQGTGDGYEVRCVRGTALWIGDLRFTQGTYIDRRTGLQWQAETAAQQTLDQGLSTCESLDLADHTDWRLPSIKELETLVDRTDSHSSTPHSWPGIVNSTENNEYWSSTPVVPGPGGMQPYGWWVLSFDNAKRISGRYSSGNKWVRCVRGSGN